MDQFKTTCSLKAIPTLPINMHKERDIDMYKDRYSTTAMRGLLYTFLLLLENWEVGLFRLEINSRLVGNN